MDKQYELYCLADPLFYDTPDQGRTRDGGEQTFSVARRALPDGWQRAEMSEWVVCQPGVVLPWQGWKIHVSACLDNAEDVLERVWDHCVARGISFKFLRSRLMLHMRSAKYAPRGASGKLVTIYPLDDAHCEEICGDLEAALAGQPGPYILSDLRIGDGPVYVRYGAFARRYCEDENGELVAAFEDGAGRLVPDRRGPVFMIPGWVKPPRFLAPHLAARKAATTAELPYRIDRALHFSNGGGVYVATDVRTGEQVVLKEARPHAGLSGDGADAVSRLRRERDMLVRLTGLDVAPNVRDYFELGGHHFMVEDFIEGQQLNSFFAQRHPYLDPEPDPDRIAEYTAWALRTLDGVERTVAAIHERGVVFNDLHIFNVMVRPDGTVALIDFEAAAHIDEGRRPVIGNPGFVAPRDRTGFAIDRYSLACMRLAMFAPLTTLIPLDRAKAAHLAAIVAELFPVDPQFLAEAVREIAGTSAHPAGRNGQRTEQRDFAPDSRGWERSRDALTRAIIASATPSRDDRLFPGDIRQFEHGGGLGLGYGAAGVLYALAATGAGRIPAHEEWLVRHATEPVQGTGLGLYNGLSGVAHVLELLGHRSAALRIADFCLSERWERLGLDLYGGLPGLALVLLALGDATGERTLRDAALRAADLVAARSSSGSDDRGAGRPGLLHGATGSALLFIRLYERTGDATHLDLARSALVSDLDRCVFDHNGALHVNEGWRVLPYLGGGSVGIGCVVDDYLAYRDDERFAQAAAGAALAAYSPYYAESGLFTGRAGMILYLSRKADQGMVRDPHLAGQVRRLSWHALEYGGGLAFPGENLFRLSMDLGSGTAGVLLALGAALGAPAAQLPFLGPIATQSRRPSRISETQSEAWR